MAKLLVRNQALTTDLQLRVDQSIYKFVLDNHLVISVSQLYYHSKYQVHPKMVRLIR
jgi:hypothetical protein